MFIRTMAKFQSTIHVLLDMGYISDTLTWWEGAINLVAGLICMYCFHKKRTELNNRPCYISEDMADLCPLNYIHNRKKEFKLSLRKELSLSRSCWSISREIFTRTITWWMGGRHMEPHNALWLRIKRHRLKRQGIFEVLFYEAVIDVVHLELWIPCVFR